MRRSLIGAFLITLVVATALPAEAGFRSLSTEIERQSGLDRVWIPFFGLARFVVRVAHPEGVHDVKLAVFQSDGRSRFDAETLDLDLLVNRHVDPREWGPLIRARSSSEKVVVFAREIEEMVTLLIVAAELDEIVVVELTLDPVRFAEVLADGGDFVSISGR